MNIILAIFYLPAALYLSHQQWFTVCYEMSRAHSSVVIVDRIQTSESTLRAHEQYLLFITP